MSLHQEVPHTAPARGDTGPVLRLHGPGDLDHLDPVASYHRRAAGVIRLFSRQLFSYRPHADPRNWQSIAPAPDLAADVPSTYNAGLGASHRCYITHLRPGIRWDTEPPREVTAQDVIRGIKRLCAPMVRSPALPYFTSTVRGLAEFCARYQHARPRTAAELADFQASHEIPGLFALDDRTVVFELVRPALDFVDILALPCASPAPAEYDSILPDSPDFPRHAISNGPYRPADSVPGRRLRLVRNPAWRQEDDPVRQQLPSAVDVIDITRDRQTAGQVVRDIAEGTADLAWGLPAAVPPAARPQPVPGGLGLALDPCLVLNTSGSPALRDVAVRRAISYAIDKAAVVKILDDLGVTARLAGSVVPPGHAAHQDIDPYATPGGRGDPAKCRAMLAEAGCPDGLTLTAVHPDVEPYPRIAASYARDLAAAGVTLRPVALDEIEHGRYLTDVEPARSGAWDMAMVSWFPDWFHENSRVFLQPMFHSAGSGNHGRYRNPAVDELVDVALGAIAEPAKANAVWQEIERHVLADAAVVPIAFRGPWPQVRGTRVTGAYAVPALDFSFDLSSLSLDG